MRRSIPRKAGKILFTLDFSMIFSHP